ncbi:hypothetical protein [Serratia sp. PL7]|uniref:hypothetical protein n=1 Tax=Serratia sp. PL7 TaxID=2952201 RepID=UPI0021AD937C|nr:hypothetical protein [Serratia sp. PL7]
MQLIENRVVRLKINPQGNFRKKPIRNFCTYNWPNDGRSHGKNITIIDDRKRATAGTKRGVAAIGGDSGSFFGQRNLSFGESIIRQ